MSVRDAIHRMCHSYPGGIPALAARMKLAQPTVYAMANPNDTSHGWSIDRLRETMHFSNCTAPLEEMCVEFGGVFLKMPAAQGTAFPDVYERLARLAKEFGDVPREVMADLKDGKLREKDLDRIRCEVTEMQRAGAELLACLESKVEFSPVRAVK